jgi:hypothetical protein
MHIDNLSINIAQSAKLGGLLSPSPFSIGALVVVGATEYRVCRVERVQVLYFPTSGRVTISGKSGTRHIDSNSYPWLEKVGFADRKALIKQFFSTGVQPSFRMEIDAYLHSFTFDFRIVK